MELVMYVGNEFIGSIPLHRERLTVPGYIGQQKRQLQQEYIDLLVYASSEPDFLVVKTTGSGRSFS